MFKDFLRNHSAELTVMAIGIGISFVISLAFTGNFGDALAQSRRR